MPTALIVHFYIFFDFHIRTISLSHSVELIAFQNNFRLCTCLSLVKSYNVHMTRWILNNALIFSTENSFGIKSNFVVCFVHLAWILFMLSWKPSRKNIPIRILLSNSRAIFNNRRHIYYTAIMWTILIGKQTLL